MSSRALQEAFQDPGQRAFQDTAEKPAQEELNPLVVLAP